MGCLCCKSASDRWNMDFTPSELSSNKCDSEWENIIGEQATFGMGSHWGPCARFGAIPGVIRVRVGFTGGLESDPNYNEPHDHTEAINLQYDPQKTNYQKLLDTFWAYHDCSLECDTPQYVSAIFFHNDNQQTMAEASVVNMLTTIDKPVLTKIASYTTFYVVEDSFQHYLLQKQEKIFSRLKIAKNQLAHSHLASRVEGYICGYAKPEAFDEELPELFLPDKLATMIRKICMDNQPAEEGAARYY